MGALDLRNISHRYGERLVVDDLWLTVERGEVVCLLGPSGCGKTTSLRIAAGLETLQAGSVLVDDVLVAEPGREIPTAERQIGMVFQDYALFPHLNTRQNVAFGLHRLDKQARREKTDHFLNKLSIAHLADKYPHTLSGGEQQRVALARALVAEPAIMLMDEPFANLDVKLRDQVRDDMLSLLQREGVATLMVTHDPEEAMLMADRIALMNAGKLVQVDSPKDLFALPNSRFSAEFFGHLNVLKTHRNGAGLVASAFGPIVAANANGPLNGEKGELDLLIRLDGFALSPEGEGTAAVVESIRPLGASSLARAKLCDSEEILRLRLGADQQVNVGEKIWLQAEKQFTFVFPAEKH